MNVLLVDDKEDNRLALRSILASRGYRVVEAASGAEALRRLLDEEFAVILVDVLLRDMNGFELVSAIKQRARTAAVPVLFVSAESTDLELIYQGYAIGAVDYLVKPLVPERVLAKVGVFADLYRQRKRIEEQSGQLLEAQRKESELRLIELRLASERRYRSLAESVPHIIWTARANGQVEYFNQRWFEYTGIPAEQAARSWQQALHPDDRDTCGAGWQAALHSGQPFVSECRLRRHDGIFRWHLCRAAADRGPTGIVSWFGTFTDIDDHKRAQTALAEFKGTLDAVLDAVMIIEPDTWRFLYVNRGAEALFGYDEAALLAMRPYELMTEQDSARFGALLAPLQSGAKTAITVETRCRHKDGHETPAELSFQTVRVNGAHVVSIARDITERKELEARLEREARTDALTGCANRRWFLELAHREIARARRHAQPMALLMLDIDEFKAVNDRYGHAAGDLALRAVAETCREALREEDVVGRIGGEEFAILLPETAERRAIEVGERVRQAVAAREITLNDAAPLRLTTSVGATALHKDDADISAIMGRADKALYAAKEAGRDRVCWG